ncbi:putative Forkhead box-like, partial [Homarus americanus]
MGGESTSFTQGQVIVQTSADPNSFTHTQVILPTPHQIWLWQVAIVHNNFRGSSGCFTLKF